MIYVLGDIASSIKKIYGNAAYIETRATSIVGKLSIDPETSGLSALVFTSNIMRGISGKTILQALSSRHPRIAIIYFYKTNDDKELLSSYEGKPNIFMHQFTKITDLEFFKLSINRDIEKSVSEDAMDLPESREPVVSPVGPSKDIFADDGFSFPTEPSPALARKTPPPANPFAKPPTPVDELPNPVPEPPRFKPTPAPEPVPAPAPETPPPGIFEPVPNPVTPGFMPPPATPVPAPPPEGIPFGPPNTPVVNPIPTEVTSDDQPTVNDFLNVAYSSMAPSPTAPTEQIRVAAVKPPRHYEFTPGGAVSKLTSKITTVNDVQPVPGASVALGFSKPEGVNLTGYGVPERDITARVRDAATDMDPKRLEQIMSSNSIVRNLMKENSQYVSAKTALNVLNSQISAIFTDKSLTLEQKMEKIRTLCADRSNYKAVENQLMTEDFIGILHTVTACVFENMEAMREEYQARYGKLELAASFYGNLDKIHEQLDARMKAQLDLTETLSRLRKLYLVLDNAKDDMIKKVANNPPSDNALVNLAFKPLEGLFDPANMQELVTNIVESVESSRCSFAQVEHDLTELMESIFKVYNINDSIIEQQDKALQYLRANKVEDVVICDSLLKFKLATIVGPDNVGKTATAVCVATAKSRIDDTLLIDLSSNSKLSRYIQRSTSLADFYEAQVHERFSVVQRKEDDIFNEYKLTEALTSAAAHYRFIFVIVGIDDTEEYEALKKLSLSVDFVTDVTQDKLDEIRPLIQAFDEKNTARRVTLVNCQVNAMDILNNLCVDPFTTHLTEVPFFREIQMCGLKGLNPCDSKAVGDFFKEVYG